MLKKVLKLSGFGAMLGITVCTVITAITCDTVPVSPEFVEKVGGIRAALIIQTALSALYGMLCMGTTVIYDIDRLPLTLMSFIHCIICIAPFIPLSLMLGWSDGIGTTLIMTGFQLLAYFVVWLVMYARYKKEIKELNEMQRQNLKNMTPEEDKK